VSIRSVYALVLLLADQGSIGYLASNWSQPQVIPEHDEDIREMVAWALSHHSQTGRAPSRGALEERYTDVLERHQIDLDVEPEDTIQEVLETLHGNWVRLKGGEWSTTLASEVAQAPISERVAAFQRVAAAIVADGLSLQPRSSCVDLRESGPDLMALHREAQEREGEPRGIVFGLDAVDRHTQGVWPGELAINLAYAKMGKSRLMDKAAYRTWEQQDELVGLWTMENSILMTQLYLACEALGLDSDEFYRKGLRFEHVPLMEEWVHDVLEKADVPLFIFGPSDSMLFTPESIVSQARARDVKRLFLDQLTYMSAASAGEKGYQKRWEELKAILRSLYGLLSTGSEPLACMLNHQVNREGAKEMLKTGKLQAFHGSEGVSVEQFCTFLFGLQATQDQMDLGQRTLAMLASRRVPPRDFDLMWRLDQGLIEVLPDPIDYEAISS